MREDFSQGLPMPPALLALASRFPLLQLRFCVQLKRDAELPAYKGSLLHGWLGHALKAVDERAFHALYGEHDPLQPKAYVVRPNGDHKTGWHAQELYEFDLLLFGEAIRLADVVVEAARYGQRLGLGPQRTPFELVSVASVLPLSLRSGLHACTLGDWLPETTSASFHCEYALHYLTPVRLKQQGTIQKHSPPRLEDWLNHIARRLKQLGQCWVTDDPALYNALYGELPRLGDYETRAHVYHEDWQRFSLREQKLLPFGGLMGQVSYCGDIAPALPWLKVGEVLHVGGKSTFGLGRNAVIG